MNNTTSNTYTFHVSGMHCSACEHLIEGELGEQQGVKSVHADLGKETVTITHRETITDPEALGAVLTTVVQPHGYTLHTMRESKVVSWTEFTWAIPIAVLFFIGFVFLQKAGIVNLIGTGEVSYGTAFVIGVIASLSSCMAVVGGLVLSLSASYAKEEVRTIVPHTLFHVSRIVSFFILGGIIGAIGTAFTLSTAATFILGIVIGIIMLILGLNLLDVFSVTKKLQLSMPRFFSRHARGMFEINHTYTPILAGVATFFLPCGFTQSMQLYTLGSGSFIAGGLTMLTFALGTFPVLALMSVVSFKFHESKYAGVFFKTAGLVVIGFAIMNIINSFVVMGYISPVFTF